MFGTLDIEREPQIPVMIHFLQEHTETPQPAIPDDFEFSVPTVLPYS